FVSRRDVEEDTTVFRPLVAISTPVGGSYDLEIRSRKLAKTERVAMARCCTHQRTKCAEAISDSSSHNRYSSGCCDRQEKRDEKDTFRSLWCTRLAHPYKSAAQSFRRRVDCGSASSRKSGHAAPAPRSPGASRGQALLRRRRRQDLHGEECR